MQGLPIRISQEHSKEKIAKEEVIAEQKVQGEVKASFLGFGTNLQGNSSGKTANANSAGHLEKNLEERIISDYAFEQLFDVLEKNKIFKKGNFDIGDTILLDEKITFFDIEYLKRLFYKKGLAELMTKFEKSNLEKMRSLRKRQKNNSAIEAVMAEKEENIKRQEEASRDAAKYIEIIDSMLPYARFIMTKECMIVLNDESFRDKPDSVAFKYGGEMHLVGYVTNIVKKTNEEDTKKQDNNPLSTLYETANQVLVGLFNEADEVYIVHPLAIYY
ncbi:MAG: hypothetical protein Q4B65_01260 [Candidatus Saccharibacteria bacterium]|nr:hypothetical protein [Candidatus Saccharibacteria bacterium]